MRTVVLRECSCDDPNACSQACGSTMVDRLYVEALVTDVMVERGAVALCVAMTGDPSLVDIGYDIAPQPNYPYKFWQGDVLDMLRDRALIETVDAIHLSVPCQSFTAYRRKGFGVGDGYPDLIADVRWLAKLTGKPYVIENVPGAPLEDPIQLCGSSFGLDVRRHRLFESNVPLLAPPCNHSAQKPGRFPGATNRAPMSRATVEVGVWRIPLETQKAAMGIDREITLRELSEAIPPAYTEHIGGQLMAALGAEEMAA